MVWIGLVILLLLMGGILLGAEVLMLPGFGLIGLLGLLTLGLAGLIGWSQLSLLQGIVALTGGLLANGLTLWLFPRTAAGRMLVLHERQRGTHALPPGLPDLVGSLGEALTPLRPVGKASIGGRQVDVVTEGTYVEPGTPVRVVRVEWARVIVEPVLPT